ncbi:MAG: nitroreductase family protein [Pedobacter sp.]|nr:nitroreductase family protein [Pedobacter sp.]
MKRRTFISIAGGSILAAGGIGYLISDKNNFVRSDLKISSNDKLLLTDEQEILLLASMAPSGHNTQPWFVRRIAPFHWIICNDRSKWLPAVDPSQRETMLSIGAFIQNITYAASYYGYCCEWKTLARGNQDEQIEEVVLSKLDDIPRFDISKIKKRRTVRSNFQSDQLKEDDLQSLTNGEEAYFHYFPRGTSAFAWLNEKTVAANQKQIYRDAAEKELANWIRFTGKDAAQHGDGLTPASMEMTGLTAWIVRNFYNKSSVMGKNFRKQGLDAVKTQVSQSAGWLLITSKDQTVASLLETGKRLQRLLLKIREKGIAIHPMTQILEEAPFSLKINKAMNITTPIQLVLRCGYVNEYPDPVSIRKPVNSFVRI